MSARWAVRSGVAGLIALAAVSALASGPVRSLAELTPKLDKLSPVDKSVRLSRFAQDDRLPLSERLRGVQAAVKAAPPKSRHHLEALLLAARLNGLARRDKPRLKALREALAVAKESKDARAAFIEAAIEADKGFGQLKRAAGRGGRRGSMEPDALERWREALLPAYDKIHDTPRHLWGRFYLLALSDRLPEARAQQLQDILGDGEAGRDFYGLRQEARAALIPLLVDLGRWEEAVTLQLRADRDVGISLRRPAFDVPEPDVYSRTRQTAALCRRAHAAGLRCGDVESKLFLHQTFYDYSKDPPLPAFDKEAADQVLAEYDVLLHECFKQAVDRQDLIGETRLELEWTVGNDGQVRGYTLSPGRLRKTAMSGCLKRAFFRFRYPRYPGELQHIQVAFTVTPPS